MLWEAIGTPATDYTAYVHLVDAQGSQIAGFDGAPAGDRFPTSRWQASDRIVSEFVLPLPAALPSGDYALWAGLYESNSGGAIRLPVTDAGGLASGDGEVKIGDITISR